MLWEVIKALSGVEHSTNNSILLDTFKISSCFDFIRFYHIRWKLRMEAHGLAKFGVYFNDFAYWFGLVSC